MYSHVHLTGLLRARLADSFAMVWVSSTVGFGHQDLPQSATLILQHGLQDPSAAGSGLLSWLQIAARTLLLLAAGGHHWLWTPLLIGCRWMRQFLCDCLRVAVV